MTMPASDVGPAAIDDEAGSSFPMAARPLPEPSGPVSFGPSHRDVRPSESRIQLYCTTGSEDCQGPAKAVSTLHINKGDMVGQTPPGAAVPPAHLEGLASARGTPLPTSE